MYSNQVIITANMVDITVCLNILPDCLIGDVVPHKAVKISAPITIEIDPWKSLPSPRQFI